MATKVSELEAQVAELVQTVSGLSDRYIALAKLYSDLLVRVDKLAEQSERHRAHLGIREQKACPRCKAPVHPAARACARCGSSWGDDDEEAQRRGMPK